MVLKGAYPTAHITEPVLIRHGLFNALPILGFALLSGVALYKRRQSKFFIPILVAWLILLAPLLLKGLYLLWYLGLRTPGGTAPAWLDTVDYSLALENSNLGWLWYALCLTFFQIIIVGDMGMLGFVKRALKDRARWTLIIAGLNFLAILLLAIIWVYVLRLPKPPRPELSSLLGVSGLLIVLISTLTEQVIQVFLFVHLRRAYAPLWLAIILPGMVRGLLHADYFVGIPFNPSLALSLLISTGIELWAFNRIKDIFPLWVSHIFYDLTLIYAGTIFYH